MQSQLPLEVARMHVHFQTVLPSGSNMPGQKDMCHQVDEFIDIENLVLSAKIYAEAIYQLAK